jgi:hypothetical protein
MRDALTARPGPVAISGRPHRASRSRSGSCARAAAASRTVAEVEYRLGTLTPATRICDRCSAPMPAPDDPVYDDWTLPPGAPVDEPEPVRSRQMAESRRVMIGLLPGATVRLARDEPGSLAVPLWEYWARISEEQAHQAAAAAPSDELIDALSASLHGEERQRPDEPGTGGVEEMMAGMVAVGAAAMPSMGSTGRSSR